MTFLDVSPMLVALRASPGEFEVRGGKLHHLPTRHSFAFDRDGHVQIHARCNCATLMVADSQEKELRAAMRDWRDDYWRPLAINREFASHFGPMPAVRGALLRIVEWARRRLLEGARDHAHDAEVSFHIPAGEQLAN